MAKKRKVKRQSHVIDKLLEKHNFKIRDLQKEVNRLSGQKFSAGQFAGKRKLHPSKSLSRALKLIAQGKTINRRKFRKAAVIQKERKVFAKLRKDAKAKPIKKIKVSDRKKKKLRKQSLRHPLKMRRFIIDTSCETDSFSPYRHSTFYVYKGKAGTVKGIKISGVRQHNQHFVDHEIIIIHGIEEIK